MTAIRTLKQYFHARFILLAATELVLFFGSIYLAAYLRFAHVGAEGVATVAPLMPKALVFSIALLLSLFSMGLYQRWTRMRNEEILVRLAASFLFGGVALVLFFYAVPALYVGRGILGLALIISFFGAAFAHLLFHQFTDESLFKPNIVILGGGAKAGEMLAHLPKNESARGYRLIGFIRVPGDAQDADLGSADTLEGALSDVVTTRGIDEIVVAMDDRSGQLPVSELLRCKMQGVRVSDAVGFVERETGKVHLDLLYPSWLVFSEGYGGDAFFRAGKRVLDIAASLALLVVAAPVMLITALAIWATEGWRVPVFYGQTRVGQDNQPFEIVKFRSMVVDAEKFGNAQWAEEDDPRITRVGRFMRKFRIDELPQIINVIRGDMSFVGPRPERPQFVEVLAQRIPYYMERHRVKPGITGWAQLNYPYGATEQDALEKLQYELYYLKKQSLLFDLMIVLQTVEVVLFGKGAR
ncbi:MAG: TIGR03013 family XrtA/PEP-CTERM system glycosyltransferase [Pseudomonadota bacterium]|nr:TIGR03013 family XrtA/PEP-CTERM system glycosyltransferase [Pseudomonadota bacterium]